ncbi:hypothetical protein BH18ACT8_BH18ACT8_09680 [soil metagenome]
MSQRQQPSANPDQPPRASPAWLTLAVPAATFLIGLVLGGVVVGVGTDGDDSSLEPTVTTPPADAAGSPTASVTVVVPEACIQAAETVNQATALIRDGVSSIRDFQPEQLVDLLNQLEDLDAQARAQAQECSKVDVSQTP